ncbi:peptidoglycan glycosyltransferase FtsW [Microbacterium sp. YY-03]|uniref:peptidoglycan glycosyltransferase FtsW n=1 Tax=Microbacterium sp. YY-03 TaxID=3421636 RepID=UPI003D16C17A
MTSNTTSPTPSTEDDGARGQAARVFLGLKIKPVPVEFMLIASAALLLTIFGLVMVLSATSASPTAPLDTFMKQGVFALIGIPLMFVLSRFSMSFFKKMAWPILGLALVLQSLILTPLAVHADGNTAWVMIAGQQFQPAEFLKVATALWVGYVLYRKQALLGLWRHVFIPLVPVSALILGSVLVGKDLGTAMVLMMILLSALYFSGVKLRVFFLPLIIGAIGVAVLALTNLNRLDRIMSVFSDCTGDAYDNVCYQPMHGIWGLASGGIFGLGLGNSKMKYEWLPAAQNDYIFAIVGEELGLIGCLVVLALFATFAVGAFRIVRRTPDPFVRIVSGAIAVWIVGQALINIGVVLRLLPPLGVPLPFMSQGGTSLLSVLIACGVLLSFTRTLPEIPASTNVVPMVPRRRTAAS